MNIRSLTRGDGVVIGAALLLFIASFLDLYSYSGSCDMGCPSIPGAWSASTFPALPSIFLAGLIGAALTIAARFQPEDRGVAGLGLEQWGVALSAFATWTAVWSLFGGGSALEPGVGLVLATLALLVLTGTALVAPRVPALGAALLPEPRPAQPQPYPGAQQPYGAQPGGSGYGGYPGGYSGTSYQPQPTPADAPGGGQPQPGTADRAPAAQAGPATAAQEFAPFWFAVPVTRSLHPEDGSPTPVAELTPGTWYLAVDQSGAGLIAQTQDGRRGVLRDTTGIQRG